jgi:hypothetical protein
MGMMNYKPTKEDIRTWMLMTDTDKDGRISLAEYEDIVISSLEKAGIKIIDENLVIY